MNLSFARSLSVINVGGVPSWGHRLPRGKSLPYMRNRLTMTGMPPPPRDMLCGGTEIGRLARARRARA